MTRRLCRIVAAGLVSLSIMLSGSALAQDAVETLEELLDTVRSHGQSISQENRAREQEFRQNRDRQKAMLDAIRAEVRSESARSDQLKSRFDSNEQELEALTETLRIRVGDMGELFGIVRQVSGETKSIVESSLVSAELTGRGDVAERLAAATALPSISDLRDLQALLLEEMIESGKIVRFSAEVEDASGIREVQDVVRIGAFNTIAANGYLAFNPSDGSLSELPRQPAGRFLNSARDFFGETAGAATVALDPSRGNLLSLVIQSPSFFEQVSFGGTIGYTILAMGAIGVLIALARLFVLQTTSRRINAQRKSDVASQDNPLGRIYAVYESNANAGPENLELKLDEAIIREVPKLERFQSLLKVIAGVAPLMGLLGTVVGMIKTFQTITLFGTGDPKLMADGISQALVTTVEGLVVAIPLVFFHAVVSGKSKELIEILEEQSAGLIARASDKQ